MLKINALKEVHIKNNRVVLVVLSIKSYKALYKIDGALGCSKQFNIYLWISEANMDFFIAFVDMNV